LNDVVSAAVSGRRQAAAASVRSQVCAQVSSAVPVVVHLVTVAKLSSTYCAVACAI
jgi:hypothetical protein